MQQREEGAAEGGGCRGRRVQQREEGAAEEGWVQQRDECDG